MAKVAIVTGAGTGVGRAAALALMKAGYSVALAGPAQGAARGRAEGRRRQRHRGADRRDRRWKRSARCSPTVKEKYGRLDVLFNNAGMGAPPVPFEELPVEKWKEVVDTNLTALFVCTQEAFKIMKDQNPRGGRIINNGSISAHTPRPRSAAYTSTKHAVTGLTKSTALDGRAYDIACSQIDIGNAATPMTDRMVQGVLQPDGAMMPEPRMDAEHVGRAVAYMASLPLDANVLFMTVMATKMPFVGRG